jgi:alcohol dehydrogenase (cytochrome c)
MNVRNLWFGLLASGAIALSPALISSAVAQDAVSHEMLVTAQDDPNNWLMAIGNYTGNRYSKLGQINTSNVNKLVPKWIFSLGTLDAQNTTPVVHNGVMYVTASHGRTYALDAEKGTEIWRYVHQLPEGVAGTMCCDIGNRGVAIYGDKVFVATPDAHVVALDMKTGEVVWDVVLGNWEHAYTMTVAPLVVKGKVVVGMSGAEYPTRLFIEALDAETGKQAWRTYTIPGPGEPGHESWGTTEAAMNGGASAWITGSYDPDLDLLYWGTGNPNPDWDGTVRPGDNLYSNSTLALNPDTGEIKFFFQYTPADVWDYDGNNEPVLVDYGNEKVWLHGDRNGFLYKIDRTNGKFRYGVPISKVNWTTGFTPEGRPIWNQEKVPTYEYEAKDICPASEGGKWWNPMTVNPESGWVFVPSREICVDIKSAPLGEGLNPDERTPGKPYWGIGTISWSTGYGQLVAFDGKTGKKMWTVKDRSPFTSGLMSTRGGLLFAGTPEGEFRAYDQQTGEKLWAFQTGSGIFGSPSTYTVDGKQFVAVPSGFGGWTGWAHFGEGGAPWLKDSRKGGIIIGFGLP